MSNRIFVAFLGTVLLVNSTLASFFDDSNNSDLSFHKRTHEIIEQSIIEAEPLTLKKAKSTKIESLQVEEEKPHDLWNLLSQDDLAEIDAHVETYLAQTRGEDKAGKQEVQESPSSHLSSNHSSLRVAKMTKEVRLSNPPSLPSQQQQVNAQESFWNDLPPGFLEEIDAIEKSYYDLSRTKVQESQKIEVKTQSPISPTSSSKLSTYQRQQQQYIGARFRRILGSDEHIEELISLIDSTKKKLEIFSWTLGYLDNEVFEALKEASYRGVQIILTVQDVKRELTLEYLENAGIQINSDRQTHTKFLIADDRSAMIGSYNFLGANGENEEIEGVDESSFSISGNTKLVRRIRGRIYHDMICYERGKPPLLNRLCVNLKRDSNFYLLTNLLHHEEFFKCMVQIAEQRIIIYSPFVNYRNALTRLQILEGKIDPGVKLLIHVLPEQAQKLEWALNKCQKLKGRTTIKTSYFHRKSLIVDPESSQTCYFSEGSFNWLSAATDINSEICNQETSVVLSGLSGQKYFEFDQADH